MTWEQLWAFGRYDLGLSEAEFWALTLYEIDLLAQRRYADVLQRDIRAALTPWGLACAFGSKAKLEDFVPSTWPTRAREAAPPTTTPAQRQAVLQAKAAAVFGALAGGARGQADRR